MTPAPAEGGETVGEEELGKMFRVIARYAVYLKNPFMHYEELPKERLLRIIEKSKLVKRIEYRSGVNNCISGTVEVYSYGGKWIAKLEEIGMDECGAWGELVIAMIPKNEVTL